LGAGLDPPLWSSAAMKRPAQKLRHHLVPHSAI
jgi:hypothetical protein